MSKGRTEEIRLGQSEHRATELSKSMLQDLNNQSVDANDSTQNEFANTINMQIDENSLLQDFIKNKDKYQGEENEQFLKMQVDIILNKHEDEDQGQFQDEEEGQDSYRKQLDSHNLIGEEIRRYITTNEPHSGSVVSTSKNPYTLTGPTQTTDKPLPPIVVVQSPLSFVNEDFGQSPAVSGPKDSPSKARLDSPTGWPEKKKHNIDSEFFESALEEPLLEAEIEADLEAADMRTAKEEEDGSEWKSALEFNTSNRFTSMNKSQLLSSQAIQKSHDNSDALARVTANPPEQSNLFQSVIMLESEPNNITYQLPAKSKQGDQFYSMVEYQSQTHASQIEANRQKNDQSTFAISTEFVDLTNIGKSNPLEGPDLFQSQDPPAKLEVPAADDDEDEFYSVVEGSTMRLSNLAG